MKILKSNQKFKSRQLQVLTLGFLLSLLALLAVSCSESDTIKPLRENNVFYQNMALTQNIAYNVKIMRENGIPNEEIVAIMEKKVNLHNTWFRRLKSSYPDLEEKALAIMKDIEFFREKISNYTFSVYNVETKSFVTDRSENYPAGPCGGACGDLQLNAAVSCHSGCTFSYANCLDQGGGEPFCSNVLDSCGDDCCQSTCPH